ncbi:MAG: type II toxin-antitoxin system RelE/ParE family toxin [Nocardioidaceae bacterium]
MTLPWREHPAATDELLDAIRHYGRRQAGLGEEFAAEVARSIKDIQWKPEAWQRFPGWNRLPVVRSRRVDVFPYRIVYFVRDDDEIVIVAYAATARRPGYWKQRVDG